MTIEAVDPRRIIIPRQDTLGMSDIVINVEPIDDPWLTERQKNGREAAGKIIRNRVEASQRTLEEELDIDTEIAKFLSYTELNTEYRLLQESWESKASKVKEDFELKKADIHAGGGSRGRKLKLIQQSWRAVEPEYKKCMEVAQNASTVRSMILEEAALEIFSVNTSSETPLAAVGVEAIAEEAKKVTFDNPRLLGHLGENRAVNTFIEDLATKLEENPSNYLMQKADYRYSPSLIENEHDIEILGNVMRIVNQELDVSSTTDYKKLGESYLKFLVKRANYLSTLPSEDGKYPYISLINDILAASFYRGNLESINNISSVIDNLFDKVSFSPQLEKEAKRLAIRGHERTIDYINGFAGRNSLDFKNIKDRILAGETVNIPQNIKELADSPEFKLEMIENVLSSIGSKTGIRIDHKMRSASGKDILRLANGIPVGINPESVVEMMELLEVWHASKAINKLGNEMEVGAMWVASYKYLDSVMRESGYILSDISNDDDVRKLEPAIYLGSNTLTLPESHKITQAELKALIKDNEKLWKDILNESKWFVSPRGDKFSQANDIELTELNIEAVTFLTDKQYPREHKVIINYPDGNRNTMWLDTEKNLLAADRRIVFGDPRVNERLKNILLRRLFYITSGALAEQEKHENTFADGESEDRYKRAYYALLKSTDKRKITMQSHGAILHAEEIKKDYGIDIFAEIERRRMERTLEWNEFITFVREHVPAEKQDSVEPNEIVFDPLLLDTVRNKKKKTV